MEITQKKFKELESEIFKKAAVESLYDGNYKNNDTEFTVVDGMLNGKYVRYYSNGNIRMTVTFVDNKRHGECTFYFTDGKIHEKYNYVKGQRHGEYVSYYPDGNLAEKCNYLYDDKYDFEKYDFESYYPANKSFEYALIPIKHASEALVEVCNDESVIKPYYEPRFDKNEVLEYEWDKRPNNAILITQKLFGAYEQEYIEKVYGGSWHVNNELSDETPYVLDILKAVYGEKEIDKML